jgi:hypothetical protein
MATVTAPTLSYADTTVSGGTEYFYVVTAEDDCTESANSNQASATATGMCMLPPDFAGLQTVTNPAWSTCTLQLAWSQATVNCPDGGPVYSVYRSTIQGFTPTALNRVAEGVVATAFTDRMNLVSGETYYYVVRAADDSHGIEETNTVEVSGVPTGVISVGSWTDDAGDTGSAQLSTDAPWSVVTTGGNLGPQVYYTGSSYGSNLCVAVTTPEIHLWTGAQVSFYSKYDIEDDWDKGEVQISTDGGASWERVEVNYPGYASHSGHDACSLPVGDYFCGTDSSYALYTGSLAAWADEDVMLRWVLSSDGYTTGNGWWVDDIEITNVGVPEDCTTQTEPPMFSDGFQSGDTSAWSAVFP